jgi:hypothetical protein
MFGYRYAILCAAALALPAFPGGAKPSSDQAEVAQDGQRDFDFEIGTWKTHLKRRLKPLTGSTSWVEYEGTTVVKPLLGGRANTAELLVEGPAGRIEGVSLRLYNPQTRLWSLNYASAADGAMTPPVTGAFSGGRGTFYADDMLGDRPIRVRFVVSDITANSARFEQAFSADGGKTWEVNWIATDTRMTS